MSGINPTNRIALRQPEPNYQCRWSPAESSAVLSDYDDEPRRQSLARCGTLTSH
jgi:hypothetical protein